MSSTEVAPIVLEILARRAKLDPSALALDTPLASVGIDSIGMIETIFEVEERFGITIPDSDSAEDRLKDFETPASVVRLITSLLAEQSRGT
ncbi:MAG TPA: acyl carrier protein [Vicinamibacterales bacterium]|nr:acyl carrier protein [Vicinamibacterales bacterium]